MGHFVRCSRSGTNWPIGASSVTFDGTNATQVHGNLSAQASVVTATIVDATGKTVRTLTTNGAAPGQLSMSWDGRDSSGNTLPAKHMPGTDVREVAIDWASALAQVTDTNA